MTKQYSIGRGDDCQIKVPDNSQKISRNHATLKILDNGKIFITDHSSNGTFVNGIKISPSVDYPIKRGDDISFAHVANLNWDLVPRSINKLIYYLAGGVAVIGLAIILSFFLENKPNPNQSNVDMRVQDSVKVHKADSIKQKSDKAINDSVNIDKKEKETKKAKTVKKSKPDTKTPKQKGDKPAKKDSIKVIF